MSIEDELTEIAQRMFNESRSFLLDQKPLNDAVSAYVRAKLYTLGEDISIYAIAKSIHEPND